ncbi:DNA repair protein RecN [Synechococcus sp. PCC 6716]|nr:DNA repair protein RecN [Synechococcus sp. PCC 6716]
MLQTLRIKNFALVTELEVTFHPGLNVLTGETGAGKSILLDAIDALLGGKLTVRHLRSGSTQGHIEAVFTLTPEVQAWLQRLEIEDMGGELLCSREFSLKGETFRSRTRVNGVLVNRQQLQELRRYLVRLTAQGQAIQLASPAQQRDWLDHYGGVELLAQRQRVSECYQAWQRSQRQLAEFTQAEQQRLQRLDLLKLQLSELEPANLNDPHELETLQQQYQRLSHIHELQEHTQRAYYWLYEEEPSATGLLGQAQMALQALLPLDRSLAPVLELLEGAIAQGEEAARHLRTYAESLEADPETLDRIGNRIHQLQRLCRKYGPDLASVMAYRDCIAAELSQIQQHTMTHEHLEHHVQAWMTELTTASARLHELRAAAADQLQAELLEHLQPLGLPHARFQVQLESIAPSSHGSDHITFLWSANPGQPLQPLGEVASGGEISRFLLALETCLTTQQTAKILIFDEIDAGVSGRIAGAIADSLYRLSRHHQTLCVTHQSLIAAAADHHYHVQKFSAAHQQQTTVAVYPLHGEERLHALADLAGGDRSAAALSFARRLLEQQQQRQTQQLNQKIRIKS